MRRDVLTIPVDVVPLLAAALLRFQNGGLDEFATGRKGWRVDMARRPACEDEFDEWAAEAVDITIEEYRR